MSHTLVGLESELGVDLFHRLPRGMGLTDAGEAFVAAARRALHEAEVARRSVDPIRGLLTGQVSVVAAMGWSVALADLIGHFSRRHPQVVVRVLPPETADGVAELVRSGLCDLGFTWRAPAADDLDALPVFVDPGVVVVPEGHRLASRRSVRIEDLEGERMLAAVATSTMRWAFEALLRRHGVEPTVVAEAATDEMLLELVRAGVGCTITFASNAASVLGRGAVVLEIPEQPLNRFFLVTRTRQDPTPATRAFRDLTLARFAE